MKLITGILLVMMVASAAFAQNPDIIQNTKSTMNAVAKKAEMDQNAALQAAGVPSKPTAGTAAKPVAPQAKPAVVPVKVSSTAKPAVVMAKPSTPASAPSAASAQNKSAHPAKKAAPIKIAVSPVAAQPKQGAQKTAPARRAVAPKSARAEQPKPEEAKAEKSVKQASAAPAHAGPASASPAEPTKETRTITAEGRRDPFVSPVVSRSNGPNCSTGKRCLAIDQILVRGVVKSDSGMIAVVVNSINKAYFLKENDPVYNGYVLRITGDSVVFKETFQDRLGKESTREIVKKITTPAV
jgi:hypothetical protein